jgi:hypothetical protein
MYEGYNASSESVVIFWRVVEQMSFPQRVCVVLCRFRSHFSRWLQTQARLLQFCTGSARVPVEGFQALQGTDKPRKFCIQRVRASIACVHCF